MDYRERLKYQYGGVQFPEYESMYVDLKRPEIAQGLSDRYDANKAEYDTLQRAIGSVQTLHGDKPVVQALANRVDGKMSGIVNSGAYEFGAMAVSDSVTDFMTDQNVLDSVKSWENRQKELEVIAERRANGLQTYDFGQVPVIDPATGMAMRDPATGEVITQHVTDTHVTANQGVYQPLSENKLAAEEKARQLMQGIRDDPILLGRIQSTDPELAFFLRSGKAVTADKIERVANAVLPLYAESSEGLQKMRALQQITVNDATGTLYDPQEAQQVLLQDLISAAAPQQGTDYQYTQSALMKALGDQETPAPLDLNYVASADTSPNLEEIDFDDYFNSDGSPKGYEANFGQDASYQEWLNTEEGQEMMRNERLAYGDDEEFYKAKGVSTAEYSLKRVKKQLAEGKDLLNIRGNMLGKLQYLREEYENVIPRLPGQTDREYSEELWKGVVQGPMVQVKRVYRPKPEGITTVKSILGNSGTNLKVLDLDNPTTTALTLDEWHDRTDRFGIDEDWKGELINTLQGTGDSGAQVFINGLTVGGPLSGGIEVTYISSDDDKFNLVLSPSDKELDEFRELGKMADLVKEGKPGASKKVSIGKTITRPGVPIPFTDVEYSYIVQRNPQTGEIDPQLKVVYINSKTNQRFPTRKNPNELGNMVKGILDNSQKRGSELGTLFVSQSPKSTTILSK